jgi:hypothetical protein
MGYAELRARRYQRARRDATRALLRLGEATPLTHSR